MIVDSAPIILPSNASADMEPLRLAKVKKPPRLRVVHKVL